MFKSLITVITVFSLSLAGDLKLSCDVEPAWIVQAGGKQYVTPEDIKWCATKNAFSLAIKPSFEWRFLYGWFDFVAFSASPKRSISFAPFRMSFSNEIGLTHQFSSVKVSTGWLHNCQHRVSIGNYSDWQNYYHDTGYDLIFMRFHFSNF